MGQKKRGKIIVWLVVGAVVVFIGLTVEFFRHRYQVNRTAAFTTEGTKLQLRRDKKNNDFFIKGLVLHTADVGTAKSDYAAWIKRVAALNVNVIQVHEALPPAFYQAFFEYNILTDRPVYLLHGIWLDDAVSQTFQNAYAEQYIAAFFEEIRRIIDTVHGKSSNDLGKYNFNVAPYVMGYILCEPPDAAFVTVTNEQNVHVIGFEGDYLYTANANPYEAWMAAMGNFAVSYEKDKYGGSSKLISWTNRAEVSPVVRNNDSIEIDFEHINATEQFNAGIFASYRAASDETRLRTMQAHHSMPVLVMEWEAPATRTEAVFEDIVKARIGGGVIFSMPDDHLMEFYAIIRQLYTDH